MADMSTDTGAIVIDLEAHRKFREWLNTHQDMPEDSILWGLTSVDDE